MQTVITARDKLAAGLSVLMFGDSPEKKQAQFSAIRKELPDLWREFWKALPELWLFLQKLWKSLSLWDKTVMAILSPCLALIVLIQFASIGIMVGVLFWEWNILEALTSFSIVIAPAVGLAALVASLAALALALLPCLFVYALGAYCVRFIGVRGDYNLGMKYCKEWNLLEGAKWLRRAAFRGHLNAYFELGCLYADGKFEMFYERKPAKKRQTEILLRGMMAPIASADAQALKKFSFRTADFPKDYREAAKWWLIAAKRGHAEAQFRLGQLYLKGEEGVPQDDKEAYIWLFLAALNDSKFGVVGKWGRDEAAANLSPEIRAAQMEAENRFERLAKIRLGMIPPAVAKFMRHHHIDKLRRKLGST